MIDIRTRLRTNFDVGLNANLLLHRSSYQLSQYLGRCGFDKSRYAYHIITTMLNMPEVGGRGCSPCISLHVCSYWRKGSILEPSFSHYYMRTECIIHSVTGITAQANLTSKNNFLLFENQGCIRYLMHKLSPSPTHDMNRT